MPVLVSINGNTETRTTVTDEQYIAFELSRLARCCHLMPSYVSQKAIYDLIKDRHDREHWINFFKQQLPKSEDE